jgi:outer membrane protein assembly factor BamB
VNKTASPRAFSPAYFPGWIARSISGVMLSLLLVVSVLRRWADPPFPLNEPAICNILTLIFSFIIAVTLMIWFCFFSNYALIARRGVLVMALGLFLGSALVIGAVGVAGVMHFDGNMVPRLVLPGRKPQKLETGSGQPIDLATTTPDDFPQFLGPERSGWVSGPTLGRDWSKHPPKQLWKRPIGAGWSGFAAVNGYAVTMEQRDEKEWVSCYEIASGQPVWGHSLMARHENPLGGIGPRSTPTIHRGRVYALGASGVLRCLDGATGKLLWSDDLRQRYGTATIVNRTVLDEALVQWGRAGSPLIVDDLVIVPGGGPDGAAKNLVAFDTETGRMVWESENRTDDGKADQIAYASPSLATLAGRRQILIVNESTASGHDPSTGRRLWSFPWPGHSSANASASQAVAIDDRHVLLSKGYSGGAELLEISSDQGDGNLAAASAWKSPRLLQTKLTNVVVRGGHAYGLSEGILECVELQSGKRTWKNGRYEHGQILGVGELLLVLSEDGELHLVELTPSRFSELGSFPALSGKTWNTLCLYGNLLLIRNADEAACLELPRLGSRAGP